MSNQQSIRKLSLGLAAISTFVTVLAPAMSAEPRNQAVIVVRGNIEKFTTTPDGQTDGVILDNEYETILQWPPHFQEKFKPPLQPGDRVRAVGRPSTDSSDTPRFLVKSLTSLRSRQSV